MTGEQQRRIHREREDAMVARALSEQPPAVRYTPAQRPVAPEVRAAVQRVAGSPPRPRQASQQPPDDAGAHLLVARGWQRLESTRPLQGVRVTYWRKLGHEFPQHFAVRLEHWNANLEWLLS